MRAYEALDLGFGRPHPARMYAYWLGGKDHFQVDRDAADALAKELPSLPVAARANRAFMIRAVSYLAGVQGIRQFLDVGAGLPVEPNLHEVAQGIDARSRVVYVDNDAIVLAHARALLTSPEDGTVNYLDGDLRDPAAIVERAGRVLDFSRPVAVTLIAVLHLLDDDQVGPALAALTEPLCPGSAVAVTVVTGDSDHVRAVAAREVAEEYGLSVALRSRGQARAMLAGLELVDPGVVLVHRWRPGPGDPELADADVHVWGAVGIKPDIAREDRRSARGRAGNERPGAQRWRGAAGSGRPSGRALASEPGS